VIDVGMPEAVLRLSHQLAVPHCLPRRQSLPESPHETLERQKSHGIRVNRAMNRRR
jgi:hypothetical protein